MTDYAPDLPVDRHRAADPLDALRAFVPKRRVLPDRGHAAVHRRRGRRAQPTTRSALRADGPAARRATPSASRLARFIETDLVIVFDHLTHTAERDRVAPHGGARPRGPLPDRRAGDLRGARADGPPEPGRDAAPSARSTHGRRGPARRASARSTRASAATSTSARSSARRTRSRPARRSRSCSRAARRSTSRATRRAAPIDGIGLYRALRRVNPSPYLFFTRTPAIEVVGASPELLSRSSGTG